MPSDVERRALAEVIERLLKRYPTQALRCLAEREWRVILAALRDPCPAPERGDAGAEAMRAAAAEVVRYRGQRARIAASGEIMSQAGNRAISDACAVMEREIRTIPLTTAEQDRVQGEESGI